MTIPTTPWLETPAAFAAFVDAWTHCTLPKADWTHSAHVAIAAHCVTTDPWSALARLREGIQRYNLSIGGLNTDSSGYHETLTRFWTLAVTCILEEATPANDYEAARIAVAALGHNSALFRDYYSWDPLTSRSARATWFPPDRVGPFGPIE